jgi:hypothetical protein
MMHPILKPIVAHEKRMDHVFKCMCEAQLDTIDKLDHHKSSCQCVNMCYEDFFGTVNQFTEQSGQQMADMQSL